MPYDLDPCFCASCLAAMPARRVQLIEARAKLRRSFHLATMREPDEPEPKPERDLTLEETGAVMGLCRVTVRKIEAKALRKLRRKLEEVAA